MIIVYMVCVKEPTKSTNYTKSGVVWYVRTKEEIVAECVT